MRAINELISPDTLRFTSTEPFSTEQGSVLPEVEIAYRTWGTLNAECDNVVLVCHALTGSADVDAWWPGLFFGGRRI